MGFEGIDFFQCEVAWPQSLDTIHDFDQPTSCFNAPIPQKQGALPSFKHAFFGFGDSADTLSLSLR